MASLIGLAHRVSQAENLTPPQRRMMSAIKQCSAHLFAVADDIVDVDRAREGRIVLRPTPCRLFDLFDELCHWLRGRDDARNIAVFTEIQSGLPEHIVVDPLRLRQVLLHLASHAIRHTPRGFVALRVRKAPQPVSDDAPTAAPPWRWRFEVENTGLGVAAEDLDLLVSSELVRAMGGVLQMDREVGVGSRFWFDIDGR